MRKSIFLSAALCSLISSYHCMINAGRSPSQYLLCEVARKNSTQAVRCLLWVGTDPNVIDSSFFDDTQTVVRIRPCSTPLQWAVRHGNSEMAELLLQAGADTEATPDQAARTALHIASQHGKPAIVTQLLAKGANVNATSSNGWSSLHEAAMCHHSQERAAIVIKQLLNAGADIDAIGMAKKTALHPAAFRANAEAIKQLLQAGADPLSADSFGKLPLRTCITEWSARKNATYRENARKCIQILLERGASLDTHWIGTLTPEQRVVLGEYTQHIADRAATIRIFCTTHTNPSFPTDLQGVLELFCGVPIRENAVQACIAQCEQRQ